MPSCLQDFVAFADGTLQPLGPELQWLSIEAYPRQSLSGTTSFWELVLMDKNLFLGLALLARPTLQYKLSEEQLITKKANVL